MIIPLRGGIFQFSNINSVMKGLLKKVCLVVSISLFLCSCGNKGDLYLPEKDKVEEQDKIEQELK